MTALKNKIIAIVVAILCFAPFATASAGAGKVDVPVKDIVLGHIGDAYEWHITTIGEHHIIVPLPILVYSSTTGWHCFLSSRFEEEPNGIYEGFHLKSPGKNQSDKIFEIVNGKDVRPFDISFTRNVVELWFVVILMLAIFLGSARWYRKRKASSDAPKGFVGFIEMIVVSINDDVIKASIGEKHYRKYSPYLLTAFFFILISNMLGLIPIFPGGANLTGNIAITLFLAVCTFLAVNLFGNKEYWREIFWPEVPLWLKAPIPMMPVIELFGIFTKPFALMIRLFANILGGHIVVLSFVCVIFISCQLGAVIGSSMSVLSVLMNIFMDCLEVLVAFIQAYVFTMLSAVFISLAHQEHEA